MQRRLDFIEPPPEHFLLLLQPSRGRQVGGDLPVYIGSIRQRGFGILSFLKNIGSTVLPLLRRAVLPAVGEFAGGVLSDLSENRPFKEAIRHRGKTAVGQTWQNIKKQAGGGARKRKLQAHKPPPAKKKKKQTPIKPKVTKKKQPVVRRKQSRKDVLSR